jgi:glyoxylase-like metal-dependent hydrolase (beta-lactamase superfamily II)
MNDGHLLKDAKLQCRVVPVTWTQQNCSLLWCLETRKAAIVDPGGDVDLLLQVIEEEQVEVERLLITHAHPDHAGVAAELSGALAVPIEGPNQGDESLLKRMINMAHRLGFHECSPFVPHRWLRDQDTITVGNQTLVALHCPGHTAGHMAYFSPEARIAFVGDILFRNAVGATATARDHLELLRSIRLKLLPLGDDVLFVPGHDVLSTFGEERRSNHAVSDVAAEKYSHLFEDPRFAKGS